MDDDRRRWDERYAGSLAEVADLQPAPPDGLLLGDGLIDGLRPGGRALDVACGIGRQAVWAATRGFVVDAIDVSGVAIEVTRALAERFDCASLVATTVVDVDELSSEAFVARFPGPYDLVICQRFREPRLYRALLEVLAPGGIAVVTVLSQVGVEGGPGPHHAPPGELRDAYAPPDPSTGAESAGAAPLTSIVVDVEELGQATVVVRRRGG